MIVNRGKFKNIKGEKFMKIKYLYGLLLLAIFGINFGLQASPLSQQKAAQQNLFAGTGIYGNTQDPNSLTAKQGLLNAYILGCLRLNIENQHVDVIAFQQDLTVGKDNSISTDGQYMTTGAVAVKAPGDITGITSFYNLTVDQNDSDYENVEIDGDTVVYGDLTVPSGTSLYIGYGDNNSDTGTGSLVVYGNAVINGTLEINTNFVLGPNSTLTLGENSSLTVYEDFVNYNPTLLTIPSGISGLRVLGNMYVTNLTVLNDINVNGILNVTGGSLNIGSGITVATGGVSYDGSNLSGSYFKNNGTITTDAGHLLIQNANNPKGIAVNLGNITTTTGSMTINNNNSSSSYGVYSNGVLLTNETASIVISNNSTTGSTGVFFDTSGTIKTGLLCVKNNTGPSFATTISSSTVNTDYIDYYNQLINPTVPLFNYAGTTPITPTNINCAETSSGSLTTGADILFGLNTPFNSNDVKITTTGSNPTVSGKVIFTIPLGGTLYINGNAYVSGDIPGLTVKATGATGTFNVSGDLNCVTLNINNTASVTTNGSIASSVATNIISGALTVTGVGNVAPTNIDITAGNFTFSSHGTLTVPNGIHATTSGNIIINNGTFVNATSGGIVTASGNITFSPTVLTSFNGALAATTGTVTIGTAIPTGLTTITAGSLSIAESVTTTGAVTVTNVFSIGASSGATVTIGNGGLTVTGTPATNVVIVPAGTILAFTSVASTNGINITSGNINVEGTINLGALNTLGINIATGNINMNGAGSIILSNNTAIANGNINITTGSITNSGSGMLTIACSGGDATHGGIRIGTGDITNSSTGATSGIMVNSGGIGITNGNLTVNSGSLIINDIGVAINTGEFNVLAGVMPLIINGFIFGAADVTLNTINTGAFSTINCKTLSIAADITASGAIETTGDVTINSGDVAATSLEITGAGNLNILGTSTLTLNLNIALTNGNLNMNSNNYLTVPTGIAITTGNVNINAGTFTNSASGGISTTSGNITFNPTTLGSLTGQLSATGTGVIGIGTAIPLGLTTINATKLIINENVTTSGLVTVTGGSIIINPTFTLATTTGGLTHNGSTTAGTYFENNGTLTATTGNIIIENLNNNAGAAVTTGNITTTTGTITINSNISSASHGVLVDGNISSASGSITANLIMNNNTSTSTGTNLNGIDFSPSANISIGGTATFIDNTGGVATGSVASGVVFEVGSSFLVYVGTSIAATKVLTITLTSGSQVNAFNSFFTQLCGNVAGTNLAFVANDTVTVNSIAQPNYAAFIIASPYSIMSPDNQ